MSDRRSPTNPDQLRSWMQSVESRLVALTSGRGRGPNSSWGLPFRMGDWEWFDNGLGQICARNVVTGVVQCPDGGGDCCECHAFSAQVEATSEPEIITFAPQTSDRLQDFMVGAVYEDSNAILIERGGLWQLNAGLVGTVSDGDSNGSVTSVLRITTPLAPATPTEIVIGHGYGLSAQTGLNPWSHARSAVFNLPAGSALEMYVSYAALTASVAAGSLSGHFVCDNAGFAEEVGGGT